MPETITLNKKKSFRSIASTLFFAFLIVSIFVLFLESVINISFGFQQQQQIIYREQQSVAQAAAKVVKEFVDDRVRTLSDTVIVSNLSNLSKAEQIIILNRILKTNSSFRQIAIFNNERHLVANASQLSFATFDDFSKNINAALFSHLQTAPFYISNVYIDNTTNEPIITMAVPIRDAFGDYKGALAAEVNLKFMWELVANLKIGEQGTAYVVDQNGYLLASANTSKVLKKENLRSLKTVDDFLNNTVHTSKQVNEIVKGIDGTRVISTYAKIADEPNWAVVVELPATEAYQYLIQELITSGVIFLISLIVIIFASNILTRRIVRPIIVLRDAAKQISNGDLNTKIDISSHDEIGELANTFNQMMRQLKGYYDELEQKVKDKTKALSEKVADMENAKKAITNVMEDLQVDKVKIDEQKNILDSVIHNMPIGVALSEPNGKSILINEVGISLLGRGMDPNSTNENSSEIFGLFKADGTPYPTDELPTVLALREGKPVTKDDVVVHKPDGSKVSMRGTSAPIKDTKGNILSVITVFEDITKERDIDRMKTEFISLASHQLRTPLSAIKWFSEMLLAGDAGDLTPEQKDFSQNISDSTERMIELVNSLLNISRMESGRIVIDPKPTDLKELVDGIVKELQLKINQKQQTLIVSVHSELPKINLDPKLIRQVYMNLLTNAIKYTQKNGEISVFISKKDDNVVSQVTDNGYGIPKAEQTKLFQKFFRATNIIKVETDGTGLGLYLIKAIIESSKGKIWLESHTKEELTPQEHQGTSFWFSLPMSGMEAKKGEVTLDE